MLLFIKIPITSFIQQFYSGIEKCCRVSCCYEDYVFNSTTTTETAETPYGWSYDNNYKTNLDGIDTDDEPLYKQPSFWILNIMIAFLIMTFMKSVYTVVMPPKIVRILQEMSKGPFNTAKEGSGGSIEPVVHYFVPNAQDRGSNKLIEKTVKAQEWIRDRLPSDNLVELFQTPSINAEAEHESLQSNSQMLDAQRLLTLHLENLKKSNSKQSNKQIPILFDYCENCNQDSKPRTTSHAKSPHTPDDDPDEESEESKDNITDSLLQQTDSHCCNSLITYDQPSIPDIPRSASTAPLSISLPTPLPPSYQPALPVPRVWSKTHTTERLYRYTHIEGIIYPPGYVP